MTPEETYVASINLTGIRREIVAQDAATEASEAFDAAKKQAQVVGSGVFGFGERVTPEAREAIAKPLLLAQLVANKQGSPDPLGWFATYIGVLQNTGWLLTDAAWTEYTATGTAVDVHEKVLSILTAALGPASTALAIVTRSVEALKAMNPDSSWIRIFNRESQHGSLARFQMGAVEEHDGGLSTSLVACVIDASSTLTQVLLFRVRNVTASVRARNPRLTTTEGRLIALHPKIEERVVAFNAGFLSSIVDL